MWAGTFEQGWSMLRVVGIAAAIAAAAIGMAPSAGADPQGPPYDGDVPGIIYDAPGRGAPCYQWDRFVFGRDSSGQALQCHWIPNQWPPVYTGFWQYSFPLHGVQEIGADCPDWRGASAQTPDGIALFCKYNEGWQPAYTGI